MRINPLFHRSTFQVDVFITIVNGVGVLAGVILLNGLIARVMGIDALGEFLLVRRTAFELLGVLVLGMNLGLPYYLAREDDRAFGIGVLWLFVLLTIPLIGLAATAPYLGILRGFPYHLVFPFFVFAVGYAMQLLTYGLLRGYLNMLGANLLQLTGTGIVPITIFFIFRDRGVPFLLFGMGLGTMIFSAAVFIARMGAGGYAIEWRKTWQLLTYGLQRVPGFLAQFILMAGVPLLILSNVSKAEIAYVNSGISLIRIFLLVLGPLGIVLLPRVSKALAAGQKARIAHGLEVMGKTLLFVSIPLALFLSLNSLAILNIWLGGESGSGAGVLKIIILALPFYLLLVAFRSPIDAASTRGYNSITYMSAALALLLVFYSLKSIGLPSLDAGLFSFIAGQLTAAVGSLYYAHKIYGISLLSPAYLMTVLGATIVSLLFLYALSILVSGLFSLMIGGIALLAAFSLFFIKARSDWVVGLRSLVAIQ
ncbi:MAG: hypothetical protein ACETWG_11395 [Candidatus Neomarinimicrobiota bacterium]